MVDSQSLAGCILSACRKAPLPLLRATARIAPGKARYILQQLAEASPTILPAHPSPAEFWRSHAPALQPAGGSLPERRPALLSEGEGAVQEVPRQGCSVMA